MFGFLLQWPMLLTLAMFPILVFMYWRLSRTEERESVAKSGEAYECYMYVCRDLFPGPGAWPAVPSTAPFEPHHGLPSVLFSPS
jgi:protein-S-isoprenylcysteine O-methyltransferase Ste14